VTLAPWLLLGLAILGAGISLHFSLAYYGRVESREVPAALCRRDEQSCVTILQTPYARVFGLPNSLLGIVFYLLTALVAVLALGDALPRWLWWADLAAAGLGVVLAPYLIWALLARLKTWCRL
jgi:uncharacterized membrane protein